MNLGTAQVLVKADTSKYNPAIDQAERKIRDFGSSSQKSLAVSEKAFSSFSKVAVAGAVGLGVAVTAASAKILSEMIPAASNLQEMQSKFDVVFAGQTLLVNEWAENLVDKYAMSTREAKQYLASIQDLLVPMGMQASAAAKLSSEIVKLSVDLGSFNNMPTAQVMENVQSALVGEYETMKKYGVVINATLVQQEALNMGLAKTKDKLTAADKAQAAYSLIVKSSAAAMGDMDRTADGYANTTKRLSSEWEDFTAVLGTKFLPVSSSVKGFFADILDSITKTLKPDGLPEYIKKLQELRLESEKTKGSKDPYVSIFAGKTSDQIAILEAKIGELNFALKESRMVESGIMAGKTANAPSTDGSLSEAEKTAQKKQADDRKKAVESIREEYDRLAISTAGYADSGKRLADLQADKWKADQLEILKKTTPELEKTVVLKKLQNQQELEFKNRYSNIGTSWDDSDLLPDVAMERWGKEEAEARKKQLKDLEDAEKESTKKYEDELKKRETLVQDYATSFAKTMNDMFWSADFSFKETLKSFAMMLTEMLNRKFVAEPFLKFAEKTLFGETQKGGGSVGGLLSSLGGAFGGLFGGGTVAMDTSSFGAGSFDPKISSFDTGGLMGSDGMKKPFPAIVHAGEVIGTPDQMSSLYGNNKAAAPQTTNIFINAVDSKSFTEMIKNNPAGIISVIGEAMTGNTGLRQIMGSTI